MTGGVLVKICGITRPEDALWASGLGADALGFNFWRGSRRYLPPRSAAAIIAALPPSVLPVGVLVDPSEEELLEAVRVSGVRAVQLHGDEPPALCAKAPVPVVKAIRIEDRHSLSALRAYAVSAFLLDSASPGYGGSGTSFDWSVAAEIGATVPVWLAGGLTPENVAEAIRRVRPRGVDVASGVESAPGQKDKRLVEAFIRNAKSAFEPVKEGP